jgi:sulfite exporter TauE/SafE
MFSFPNPVNEKAARVVAGVVMVVAALALVAGARWLLIPLALGFWARVLTGPTLSPLGRLAQSVIAPRLGPPRYVPGPPKRFAQGMGAAMTTVGAVVGIGLGVDAVADVVLVAMVVAAGLESIFALCLGCRAFALLMRAGLVPEDVCAACADLRLRP